MNKRLLILLACLGVAAVAQETVPVATTNAIDKAEPVTSTIETVPVTSYSPEGGGPNLISVSLDDVPLQDVVRLFTRISGANIIATSSNLQGKVTVNLQDVEWKPALGSILDMYSMMIAEKIPGSGIYSIQTKLTEPLIAQSIFLSHASVSNVISVVAPMLGSEGSASPFINANALVVRASAANLSDIRKVITEIDVPRKQVYIEVKFLELTDDAIKDLGINWKVLESYRVGVGSMQWDMEETRDKLKGRSDRLSQSDQRARSDELSTVYDGSGPTPTRTVDDGITQTRDVTSEIEDTYTKTLTDVRTAMLSAEDFSIMLSALKQMSGISIVSNPKIIVANEETATIHIGENEPNIRGTVTPGQQGQANTTTYALDATKPYFEIGISLDVTPTINNRSNITVRIVPTLSEKLGDKTAPDGNTYPIEGTKTIKTVFSLDNGKTAAIGGLTKTDDREVTSKIPLLGDIPLIGKWLFSHTHTQKKQTETIIFVTVGLADPGNIGQDDGLPEETELAQRLLTAQRASKTVREENAARSKTNAVAASDGTVTVTPPPVSVNAAP